MASNRRNICRLLPNRTDHRNNQHLPNIEENEGIFSDSRGENPFHVINAEPVNSQDWLLSRLHTNRYFWDTPQPLRDRRKSAVYDQDEKESDGADRARFLPLNDPISAVRGILLESDMPTMNECLNDIRQTLNDLKNFSLDAPSTDYHRFNSKKSQKHQTVSTYENDRSAESFTDIRARILNMEFHIEQRIREITTRRDTYIKLPKRDDQSVIRIESDRTIAGGDKVKNNAESNLSLNPQKRIDSDFKKNLNLENVPQPRIIITDASQPHSNNPADNEKSRENEENPKNIPISSNIPIIEVHQPGMNRVSHNQITKDSALPPTNNANIFQPTPNNAKSTHYDRMLELLRRSQFDVSSSSSSEDEIAAVRSPPNVIRPTQPAPPPAAVKAVTVPNHTQLSATATTVKANASDSDSDFFK